MKKLQKERCCTQHFCMKKAAHKMLMKLTPSVNFINVLHARLSYKFFTKVKM